MSLASINSEAEDRRTRILAITLMCVAMVCFTRLDTCAKWLSSTLPAAQIVWARYLAAALIALAATRPLSLLIVAHRFAPAPALMPFTYTQLIWMIVSGVHVFGDWPRTSTLVEAAQVVTCGAYLALRERVRAADLVTVACDRH
jgi:drug/metabolite transporter (DMT)-like permease